MTFFTGIDNGVTGALVTVDEDGTVIDITSTPILKESKGQKTHLDLVRADRLVRDLVGMGVRHFALEKSQPMPRSMRGGNATFSTGYVFGAWQGLLTGEGASFDIVSPQTWQARFLRGVSGGDTKTRSVLAARRVAARAPWPSSKAAMQAAADAYWIAQWCRLHWTELKQS
jgi:hypothetical protein